MNDTKEKTSSEVAAAAIRRRHDERRKKRIRIMKIRRTIFFSVLALIAVMIIMFYTPVFKIRGIDIQGNQIIEQSEILNCMGEVQGKNLFRTKTSAIKKEIAKLPYIQSVKIDRVVLKSKLTVTVEECEEAAYASDQNGYIVIDTSAKVLKVSEEKPENIPEITGLAMTNIVVGEQLKIDDNEKFEIVLTCLDEMKKIDILKGVRGISVADISNISFNYEDRIDAVCGSSVDLTKKLGFFKSAVNSNRLTENTRGTIDLTTIGKAIYTP